MDDVRIGDFSKPVAPAASPTKDALEAAEKRFDADTKKDEAALKPMASYEERIREVGVSREKASEIIDAVLLKGYYSEEISITSTIKARFRTRGARDTRRAQEMIERERVSFNQHYDELFSRYLLAASLEAFGGETLTHPPRGAKADTVEKMYADRLNFVENLSEPALRMLFLKLAKFDRMIATVLEEGSIENF